MQTDGYPCPSRPALCDLIAHVTQIQSPSPPVVLDRPCQLLSLWLPILWCVYARIPPLFFNHMLSLALLMTSLWLAFGPEVLCLLPFVLILLVKLSQSWGTPISSLQGWPRVGALQANKTSDLRPLVRAAVPFAFNVSKSCPMRNGWSIKGFLPGEEKVEETKHLPSTLSPCQGVGRMWWPTEETGPMDGACQKIDLA